MSLVFNVRDVSSSYFLLHKLFESPSTLLLLNWDPRKGVTPKIQCNLMHNETEPELALLSFHATPSYFLTVLQTTLKKKEMSKKFILIREWTRSFNPCLSYKKFTAPQKFKCNRFQLLKFVAEKFTFKPCFLSYSYESKINFEELGVSLIDYWSHSSIKNKPFYLN